MKSLGLSPTEQEVVDMQCEVEKKGRIFFPDFCKLCLRKFREFDEENFKQELFKVKSGPWANLSSEAKTKTWGDQLEDYADKTKSSLSLYWDWEM